MQKNNKVKVKKNRFLLIFVCIFVSLAVVLGATLGIISAIKNRNAIISYGGVTMNEEVASYFATRYKTSFMSKIQGSEDSPGFWNSKDESGKTYGELLTIECEDYLRQIVIANYLFDRYSKLSRDEKNYIEETAEYTLDAFFDGNKDKFNEAASVYGFSYSSYCDAVKMYYKAKSAMSVVCGTDGENLKGNTEVEEEYLSEYSCVRLLFIRTETTFYLDASGNRVQMGDGSYDIRKLTDAEKAERASVINDIRAYISAIGTDDPQMTPDLFDYYMNSKYYDGDLNTKESGYYFHADSQFSVVFADQFPDVVNAALELAVNGFGEAKFTESDSDGNTFDTGVCFIYKVAPDVSDLSSKVYTDFFVDFHSDLSRVFFNDQLVALSKNVKVKDAFYDINLKVLPYNSEIIPGL